MLDFARECDYEMLTESIFLLADRYPFIEFNYLTESVMGKGIPLLKLGSGEKKIYYIGAHHGAERITSAVLVKFLYDFCESVKNRAGISGISPEFIMKSRTLVVIPQLNPDGADISANGAPQDSLMYDRLLKMNGTDDFRKWQANARGVDLNHNYDAGFAEYKEIEKQLGVTGGAPTRYSGESPESEPETAALCNYLRFNMPSAVITLHTQGREIYYTSGGKYVKGGKVAAARLADLTGYRISTPQGAAAYGGLTDFCIQKLGVPSFTVECGRGQNPLPPSDISEIYAELRLALFTFPTMF